MLAQWHGGGACLLDVHHNFLQQAEIGGQTGWLHRKGATPSDCGMVVIPGSRGDYSYGYLTFSLMKMQGSSWSLNNIPHLIRRQKINGIDI